jgi:toxin-antitoxin system PIN domain toxin
LIAVDTNVLVHAHREESPWHETAYGHIRTLAEGSRPWGIPWPCVHEFLAIVTHPRIYSPPTPLKVATDQVAAWMESPSITLLSATDGYWEILRRLLEAGRVAGPQVHDARIAALCLAHDIDELWTADRDFSRFTGMAVINPLIDKD